MSAHPLAPKPSTASLAIDNLSTSLREAIARAAPVRFHSDDGDGKRDALVIAGQPRRLSPAERLEAERALTWYEQASQPITSKQLEAWLGRLLLTTINAPSGQKVGGVSELEVVLVTYTFALAEVPAAVFTETTQRQALLEFDFFPTPGKILRLLQPAIAQFRAERRCLERVLQEDQLRAEPPRQRETPSNAAIDAVRTMVATFTQEVAQRQPQAPSGGRVAVVGPLTPKVFSADLIAIYERNAASANAGIQRMVELRLAMLRRELGKADG